MTTPDPTAAAIKTGRLDLVLLTGAWLSAHLAGDPRPDLGFADRDGFLDGAEGVVHWRVAQIAEDPSVEPWLLRAIVLRESGAAVGYANFHAPPDDGGMVEIGYRILSRHRRRGYAAEAAQGMWAWAAQHGARVFRASIAPDNEPSLALVRRAGFVQVGEQIDDIDGLELVFEKTLDG